LTSLYFCLYSDSYQEEGFYTSHKIIYSLFSGVIKVVQNLDFVVHFLDYVV